MLALLNHPLIKLTWRTINPQSAAPICAHLAGIEVVGDLEGKNSTTRPDHYVVVYLDDKEAVKSEKKPRVPTPQWKWPEDQRFWFHPSSTIKIVIYRESRARIAKHLVGEYTGKVIELLETNASSDLKDKSGAGIASKLKTNLSLVSEPEESFMQTVIANVACLDSTVQVQAGISALGATLQLTKSIMDVIAGAHPILKASWTIMSAVYKAVQQAKLLDDKIRDLVEGLRETLGAAKECPDLLIIAGTTNVIEEMRRTSVKIASLIHEYTRSSFSRRLLNAQLSDDMTSRITQCLIACNNLKQQFDRRIGIDTNHTAKEILDKVEKSDANIRNILKTIKDDRLAEKVEKWLAAPDSSRNYIAAHDMRQENTCSWFLEGSRFCELQSKTADFLWIKGTAGCGKTILCSSVIDKIIELQRKEASVNYAFFFFDGRDSQNDLQLHDKLIRSILWQLSLQCNGIPAALVELYGRGHHQPSTSSLEGTLHHIINGLPSTYLVIDSLDECTEREKTLRWINQVISHQTRNLRMVVTSRPERDIGDVLQQLDPRSVDLVNVAANHDIATYLEQQLQLVTKWDKELRGIIKSRLTEHAEGMFRWVALQLMELKTCSNRQSVMRQLDSLPNGLNETYDRILSKIDNQNERTHTKTFLRWLCFSARPMKLVEIAETIVVDCNMEGGPQYVSERRYFDKYDVMEKCAGLITESDKGIVKLAHFSIKEYLLSEHLRLGAGSMFHLTSNQLSHSLIAQTCLAYLLHFDNLDLVDKNVARSFPLAPYAAEHWIFHAQSGGIDKPEPSSTLTLAKKLFTAKGDARLNWVRMWDLDYPYEFMRSLSHKQSDIGPPLYYAALAGLEQVSLHLMEHGNVNAQGGMYHNTLAAAPDEGRKGIAEPLLENGMNTNAEGGKYGNALQAASVKGHKGIVNLLLEHGADVKMQVGPYNNALQAASARGHEEIVKVLLERGADVNVHGGKYSNALRAATVKGHEAIVKLLLEHGMDVNHWGGYYGNGLQAASVEGHEGIVKLLLENGAEVNMPGGFYGNALQAASARGRKGVVKLLLEHGADVNMQGGEYSNALQAASVWGSEGTVKLLLEHGADVNMQGGGYHGNALQAASAGGHEGIVRLLLEYGADVYEQRRNALWEAQMEGHKRIVELLMKHGVDNPFSSC